MVMHNLKKRIIYMSMLYVFLQHQMIYGVPPTSVEITSPQSTICIGEPLIIKLVVKFKTPQKDPEVGNIYSSIHQFSGILIEAKTHDNVWLSKYADEKLSQIDGVDYYPLELLSQNMYVQDEKGLEYGAYYLVIYNHYKKALTFDTPGTYKIVTGTRGVFSNIDINVTSCPIQQKQCILPDPNCCDFIIGVERQIFEKPKYRSKLMSDLKTLVKQCPDSILAKWAAARIGLESFYDAEKKRGIARRKKRKLDKTVWDEGGKYLRKGLELPDDFSIREEVLYRLAEIAYEKESYSKAIPYLEELDAKYPKGKYGKGASKDKKEAIELQKRRVPVLSL